MEERLRTRFEWGLICDIQPPDLETRMAILRKKAEIEARDVPIEVCQYIAERIPSNVRELEGALIRLLAYTALQRKQVTLEVCKEVLRDLLPDKNSPHHGCHKEIVASETPGNHGTFTRPTEDRNIAFPRQVAMYLCRILTDSSLPRIGEQFGGRDHTTVLHAFDKLEAERKENPSLEETLKELTRRIREG